MIENLYAVPPDDTSRAIWALLNTSGGASNVAVNLTKVNDQQLPLLVKNVGLHLLGGAAQYPTHWTIRLRDPEGGLFPVLMGGQFTLTTAAVFSYAGGPVEIVVPPRWGFSISTLFNAGANSNSVAFFALGWYIPRGNLSLP